MIVSTTTDIVAKKFGHKSAIKMIAEAGFDAYDISLFGMDEESPAQHLTYAEHPQELFEMNVAFYNSLIPYCEKFGIKVAIENMWQYNFASKTISDSTCSRAWEFCKYIDAVNSDWIVGCLDIGHASLVVKDIPKFIKTMGNQRIQALHVHDTDFVKDLHALPFTQKIDYLSVMEALSEIEYMGDFTYEADSFLKNFPQ